MQVHFSVAARRQPMPLALRITAIIVLVVMSCTMALSATAATLDRVRQTGRINLGYIDGARPFSFKNDAGVPDGYAVTLCTQVADRVKAELGLPKLAVEWKPVTMDGRLRELQQGGIDLLCSPTNITLLRRELVSFSVPVFPSGNRAVLRADASDALRNALAESSPARPVWRGSPAAKVLEKTTFGVVAGTTAEKWLQGKRASFQIDAKIISVPNHRAGLQRLFDGDIDVFFAEQSLVLGALNNADRAKVLILDRLFTHEPAALALAREDEDFRLLVDRTLNQLYGSENFRPLYTKWFGEPNAAVRAFFLWNTLPP